MSISWLQSTYHPNSDSSCINLTNIVVMNSGRAGGVGSVIVVVVIVIVIMVKAGWHKTHTLFIIMPICSHSVQMWNQII